MSANNPSLPLTVQLLNLAGKGANAIGFKPINLSAQTLLDQASKNTGLNDFGGDEFRQPFALLLNSLEQEAELSLLGRIIAKSDLLRTLENRLKLVELFKQHPQISEQAIEQPIFVIGPPRTGTTIFHDLLAMDPDNRVPLTWETSYPIPPPETATYKTDPRIAQVRAELENVDKLIPEFKKMHPMGEERAQECVSITTHDFASLIYHVQFNVPSYDTSIMENDMLSALKWHRRFLQVLQWKAPGKRWALKSPQHMWHLQHIHREYPKALFVQTHRDPVRVLVSISSLVATLRQLGTDNVSVADIAAYFAPALAKGFNNTIAYRQSGMIPENQVVDLYFQDFVNDQIGTVRRAYNHFDLELSDTASSAMQQFLDDNAADKHGKHLYCFKDIGMDEKKARSLFQEYQEYFNIPFESV